MSREKFQETEASLSHIRQRGKLLSVIFKVVLVIFSFVWSIALVLIVVSLFLPNFIIFDQYLDFFFVIRFAFIGVFGITLLVEGSRILGEVAHGEQPFNMNQLKRLKRIAFLIFLYVVVEALFSPGVATLLNLSSWDIGYSVDAGVGSSDISINLGALFTAVGIYCFSLVFQYGVLLQQLSDETL